MIRWTLAPAALLLAGAYELAAQGKGIRFWNLTTATISGFQLSPAGKDSWGSRSRSLCTARPKQGAMVPVFPWFSQSWEPSRPL